MLNKKYLARDFERIQIIEPQLRLHGIFHVVHVTKYLSFSHEHNYKHSEFFTELPTYLLLTIAQQYIFLYFVFVKEC